MNGDGEMIETLEHSPLYQGYQRAFTATTGLPLALRPVVTWQLPLHGRPAENPFCAITAERSVDIVGDYQPRPSGFNYLKLGVKPQPASAFR